MGLAEGLRLGMRRLVSGVCVVATRFKDDRYAMTASSVTSLSNDPPSLLVCVNREAAIQAVMQKGCPFSVNVLAADQQAISNKCAEKLAGDERFELGGWLAHEPSGVPYLTSAQATFFCEVDNDSYCYGTHQIVIGRLTEVIVPEQAVNPLVYVDGGYRQLAN